jgi:hypothetical protein
MSPQRELFSARLPPTALLCGGNDQIHPPKSVSVVASIRAFKFTNTIPVIELELVTRNSL